SEQPEQSQPTAVDPEGALRALGWPMSGSVDGVLAALSAGKGVDVDNAANWPLPDLGPSAEPARSDSVARLLVTDMAPDVAMQFTPGLPTLVVSPPSLVVGVQVGEATTAVELVAHVRSVLAENLLAEASVVALACAQADAAHDAVAGASAELGVPVLGFVWDNSGDGHSAPTDVPQASTAQVAEVVVAVAGARLALPAHTAPDASGAGGSTVALGRVQPVTA
ncbi:MAG: hypothetical protein Q4G51_12800, partial [Dermatophilus congolensis]|nr:hypothetical protein [Dermatophilus congolensis]